MTKNINETKAFITKIYNGYKSYVIKELDDCLIMQKNSNATYYGMPETINDLSNDSSCILNHLYISEGQEEAFGRKLLRRNKHLKNVSGFKALRFLRPRTTGRRYIIVTLWENRQAFYHWQNSAEYKRTYKHRGTLEGIDVKVISRELSYSIRIKLVDMAQPEISTLNHLKVLKCYVMLECSVEDSGTQPYLIENSVKTGIRCI